MKIFLKTIAAFTICLNLAVILSLSIEPCDSEYIESTLLAALNSHDASESHFYMDLSKIFSKDDWDTVSIFIYGDTKLVVSHLGVYNDIANGIVFSKNGYPVMRLLKTALYNPEYAPNLNFSIKQTSDEVQYIASWPREEALVPVSVYDRNGKNYYIIGE